MVATAELPASAIDILEAAGDVDIWRGATPISTEDLVTQVAGADALVTLVDTVVDARVLRSAPRLQVVANVAVGFDNVDLATAGELGVWVTNTPDVLTDATADLTMALLLAVARRVVEAEALLRAGKFERWGFQMLLGVELAGKTLGVVGYGRIGRAVARRAASFGMRIAHVDSSSSEAEVDALFATSDVVTLHAPATARTRRMVDERRLRLMKHGAILVNTSRGALVDEAALAGALAEGRLRGAGLDVYENEPCVEPRLLAAPNAVLLPHIGSATTEARRAMAELAARNAVEVLAGRRPPNVVVEGRGW